jgi:hypothetical protein
MSPAVSFLVTLHKIMARISPTMHCRSIGAFLRLSVTEHSVMAPSRMARSSRIRQQCYCQLIESSGLLRKCQTSSPRF